MAAGLQPGETLLVHGGAGGIGNFAIQVAKALGATVLTTAGSQEKLELCESLGADRAINYHDEDFVEVVKEAGGADVILDNMGAKYLSRNVDALSTLGRLVVIGMQGGAKAEIDLGRPAGQARHGDGALAALPPGRGEDRHLRLRRRARLAAHRCGQRCAPSCTRRSRSRRRAGRTS